MNHHRTITLISHLALVCCVHVATAQLQVELTPAMDNTLYEDVNGALSNGAGSNLFVGKNAGGFIRRGLMSFDVAGSIPPGATIESVSLTLQMSQTSSGPQIIAFHPLLADWGEGTSDATTGGGGGGATATTGDATWLHTFFDTDLWQTPGGDFDPSASATLNVDSVGTYTMAPSPELIADVQAWLDDPASNFGWILVGNETIAQTTKRFDSRESTMPPVLTVSYGMDFAAVLSGSNQVPPNASAGGGFISATLTDSTLAVSGSFSGLHSDLDADIAGGAHLHSGLSGQAGSISIFLNPTADADLRGGSFDAGANSFVLTQEQIADLDSRRLYVNIHTVDYPDGEIRGQLLPANATPYTAVLAGANEVPAGYGQGAGTVVAEVIDSMLVVSGSFSGLESDFNADIAGGAHLHSGYAGQNGSISIFLNPTVDADLGGGTFVAEENTFDLTTDQVAGFANRTVYVNIHTARMPGGEIRGQMLPSASVPYRAVFSGLSQVPFNNSTGLGGGIVELNGSVITVTGAYSGLMSDFNADVAGGAHLHAAPIDAGGDIVIGLNPMQDADLRGGTFPAANNTFDFTGSKNGLSGALADPMTDLRDSLFYFNIHTTDLPGGELRGQVLPLSSTVFEASLSGDNEVPAVTSAATGAGIAVLDGNRLSVAGTFSGLESAFNVAVAGGAHLHTAPPNDNGDIVISLNTTLNTDSLGGSFAVADNKYDLSDEEVANLRAGLFYFNIHTLENAGGELRGHPLVSANQAPTSAAITAPGDGEMITITGDPDTSLMVSWSDGDPNGNDVYYVWQLSDDPAFGSTLIEADAGTNPSVDASFGDLAAVLSGAGVDLNGTTTVYHRVLSIDGSLWTVGDAVSVILTRGAITGTDDEAALPKHFALHGNYPNPFTPATTIVFDLPEAAMVSIEILDVLGRRVRVVPAHAMGPGANRKVRIDGGTLASGVYFYRLTARTPARTTSLTGQMTLVR